MNFSHTRSNSRTGITKRLPNYLQVLLLLLTHDNILNSFLISSSKLILLTAVHVVNLIINLRWQLMTVTATDIFRRIYRTRFASGCYRLFAPSSLFIFLAIWLSIPSSARGSPARGKLEFPSSRNLSLILALHTTLWGRLSTPLLIAVHHCHSCVIPFSMIISVVIITDTLVGSSWSDCLATCTTRVSGIFGLAEIWFPSRPGTGRHGTPRNSSNDSPFHLSPTCCFF